MSMPAPHLILEQNSYNKHIEDFFAVYGDRSGDQWKCRTNGSIEEDLHYDVALDAAFSNQRFHIEPLIAQAAHLLDRAALERAAYFSYGSQGARLFLEVELFHRLMLVHVKEIEAGLYELPTKETEFARDIAQEANRGIAQALSYIEGWLNGQPPDEFKVMFNEANNDKIDAIDHEKTKLSIREYPFGIDRSTYIEASRVAGWIAANSHWGHAKKNDPLGDPLQELVGLAQNGPKNAANLSRIQERRRLFLERLNFEIEKGIKKSQSGQEELRSAFLDEVIRYKKQEYSFRLERFSIEIQNFLKKISEMTRFGGSLNFGEHSHSAKARFSADMTAAYSRIRAAAGGLREVFGIELEPPDFTFDDCVNWVRTTTNELSRRRGRDQDCVERVALCDVLGDDNAVRNQLLAADAAGSNARWSFRIPNERFDRQYLLRLRGISVFVRGNDGALTSVKLAAPQHGESVHYAGGTLVSLDQSHLRPVSIGRAMLRSSARTPDVIGAQELMNASPLGDEWLLWMAAHEVPKAIQAAINDIEVDFLLTYHGE